MNSLDRFNLSSKTRQKVIKQSLDFIVCDGEVFNSEGEYIGDKFKHELVPIQSNNNKYYSKELSNAIEVHSEQLGGFIFAVFKMNNDIKERIPSLTKSDISRLLYLATFTSYDTGVLKKGDGTLIKSKSVYELVRLSKQRSKTFIDKLVHEDIIAIDSDGLIYMNPSIFFKGEVKKIKKALPDSNYTRLFKKTVRDIFEIAETKEIIHLSTIYMTLPYINLYTNIISYNPHEKNPKLVKPMDLKELSKRLGYSSHNKFSNTLNKLKVNGHPVFNYFTDVNDKRMRNIFVNPDVIHGGDSKSLEAVMVVFNSSKK